MIQKIRNLLLRERVLFSLLFLFAFIIRVWHITQRSLWNDELWTVFFASARYFKSTCEMLITLSHKFAENPFFYVLFMRGWVSLFGTGEFALRLPSVIFGSLSIPLLYILARKIVSKNQALLVSILLLFSPPHIYYSIEARCYSLLIFLSLISTYFFIQVINGRGGKKDKWGYMLSIVVMMYTHYFALFFILAHVLIILFMAKKWDVWIPLYGGAFLLFLPWVPSFIFQLSGLSTGSWVQPVSLGKGIEETIVFFAPHVPFVSFPLLFAFCAVKGFVDTFSKRSPLKGFLRYLLLMWFLLPIGIPLIASQFMKPFYIYRFALICLIPYLIYVSIGIEKLVKDRFLLMVLIIILSILSLSDMSHIPFVPAENWRQVLRTELPILVNPETPATLMAVHYYGKESHLILRKELEAALNNCPQKLFVISRYDGFNLQAKCKYKLVSIPSGSGLFLYSGTFIK